jgi:hypothetical protein
MVNECLRRSRFHQVPCGTRPHSPLRHRPTAVDEPITGTAGCCARAVSGHAAAALPRRVMNPAAGRRLTPQFALLIYWFEEKAPPTRPRFFRRRQIGTWPDAATNAQGCAYGGEERWSRWQAGEFVPAEQSTGHNERPCGTPNELDEASLGALQ